MRGAGRGERVRLCLRPGEVPGSSFWGSRSLLLHDGNATGCYLRMSQMSQGLCRPLRLWVGVKGIVGWDWSLGAE